MVDQVWAVIWLIYIYIYIYIYHFLLLTETCVVYAVYYCWRRITLTCDGGYDSICQFCLIRITLIKSIMTAIFENGAWLSKTYSESISNKESWTWLYLNLYSSLCLLITLRIYLLLQGIYSLGGQTSYRMMSWNFKVARFGFRRLQSFWNLPSASAVALLKYMSNCKSRGFNSSRDLTGRRLPNCE